MRSINRKMGFAALGRNQPKARGRNDEGKEQEGRCNGANGLPRSHKSERKVVFVARKHARPDENQQGEAHEGKRRPGRFLAQKADGHPGSDGNARKEHVEGLTEAGVPLDEGLSPAIMLLAAALEDRSPSGIDHIRVLGGGSAAPQAVRDLALDAVVPIVD